MMSVAADGGDYEIMWVYNRKRCFEEIGGGDCDCDEVWK